VNGTRHTGGHEWPVRGMDPASWPYAGQVPPSQAALAEARRWQAQSGPQLVPTFTPAGPQVRLAVTSAQPQAPAQPQPLQVHEHPEGTFTAVPPWQQWLQRCQPKWYPAPEEATPFYSGTLRDHAGQEMRAVLDSPGEPWEVAPPEHASWAVRQQAAMTPLPQCDATARFRSARAYMLTMDRLTGTRGLPLAKAALPAAGPEGSAWPWLALASGIREAGEAVAGMRHGDADAYLSLAEYVIHAPDYETALWLVGLAVEAKLVSSAEIEGSAR
jgi:hypothetical protein